VYVRCEWSVRAVERAEIVLMRCKGVRKRTERMRRVGGQRRSRGRCVTLALAVLSDRS
jgi:hypothetical protein